VVAVLLISGNGLWQGQITTGDLANAIALMLLVGFAEELLFRGWLWGELELLTGRKRAIGIQAAVFALVHPWYQLPPTEAIALLIGLVLLGLALALQRRADNGVLWGSIGLHGGLVGGWFALQAGLITLPGTSPTWLLGGGGANPNPVSGLLGWAGLGGFILIRRRWWR
jgi:membrane protease YdiL (CAAX protease family)